MATDFDIIRSALNCFPNFKRFHSFLYHLQQLTMAFRLYTELHFSVVLHSNTTKKIICFFDNHCNLSYYAQIYRCCHIVHFIKLTSNEDLIYSGIHLKWFNISKFQSFIEYTDILDWTSKSKSAIRISKYSVSSTWNIKLLL